MSEDLIAFDDLRADYVRSGFNGSFSGWLSTEITRLRALNAQLLNLCESVVLASEHPATRDFVRLPEPLGSLLRAAIAKACAARIVPTTNT